MAERSLAQRLQHAQSVRRRERRHFKTILVGQLEAGIGGAAAAIATKYLPQIVPGEELDAASPWLIGLALDGVAAATGSDDWSYISAGYGGFLTGTVVSKILP